MRFLWAVLCWPEDHPVEVFVLSYLAAVCSLLYLVVRVTS